MTAKFILSEYVEEAMGGAVYDKLDDGSYCGRIPACKGVVAFGSTLRECQDELQSTLEDWILLGLKLHHPLPVIANIDFNAEPAHESLGTPEATSISLHRRPLPLVHRLQADDPGRQHR